MSANKKKNHPFFLFLTPLVSLAPNGVYSNACNYKKRNNQMGTQVLQANNSSFKNS